MYCTWLSAAASCITDIKAEAIIRTKIKKNPSCEIKLLPMLV